MRYQLESIGVSRLASAEITAAEFAGIAAAKRGLVSANGFEEKFYVLLENYAEYEGELLNLSLRRLVFADSDWSNFQDDILTVNRRLANLLTAARLYLDQVDHGLTTLFGEHSQAVQSVRSSRTAEYESRLGYRTMEAVRNYLQHRGFPVHDLSFGIDRDEVGQTVLASHTVRPSISLAEVRRDGGLKSAILAELETKGRLVAVTPLVREYVESLGRVHQALRAGAIDMVTVWESKLTATMAEARSKCGESKIGYLAVSCGPGEDREEVQLFSDLLHRRRQLERMSTHATHLANHYVSGRVLEHDA